MRLFAGVAAVAVLSAVTGVVLAEGTPRNRVPVPVTTVTVTPSAPGRPLVDPYLPSMVHALNGGTR